MFGLSPHDLLAWMAPYVARWGYLLVAVTVVLGNLGAPVPEETILLVGGYFAAKGLLNLWGLIPTAILSATGGDSLGYWLGCWGGRRFLLQYGPALRVTHQRLVRAEKYFERYGPWTVFLARFIAGLRFMAGPLAGAFGMPFTRFLPYNLAGAIVYCSAIVSIAYISAPFFDQVAHLIALVNWVLALLALGAGLGFFGWFLWRRGTQQENG
ncbi:MAG: DedA family protein [candidate division NC10 bacterium]|nr:DedA family protein [candidate division NC10 bacterium]